MPILMYLIMSAAAPAAGPAAQAMAPALAEQPAAPKTRRVCQTIEVPMSRMPKRVCKDVAVKKAEREDAEEAQNSDTSSR